MLLYYLKIRLCNTSSYVDDDENGKENLYLSFHFNMYFLLDI